MSSLSFTLSPLPQLPATNPTFVHAEGSSAAVSWAIINFRRSATNVTSSGALDRAAPLVGINLSNSEYDGLCNAIRAGNPLSLNIAFTLIGHNVTVQSVTPQPAQAVA